MPEGEIRLVPLGGLGEFGLNALVVEYEGRRLLVDAGLMFPPADLPGIDTVVPDFDYLARQPGTLDAIVLTHGHEDHIGALPYALRAQPAPVYGAPLTLGLAERRLHEHGLACEQGVMRPGEAIERGPFRIHPIRVAHSLFHSLALAIETPAGTIVVSGDFKIGHEGAAGHEEESTDVAALAAWGERGVLALLSDSTNVELPGRMPGEDAVAPALEEIFDRASGRILVACFASSIARIQRVVDVASARGRRGAFVGRRMAENADVAAQLGLLRLPPGVVVSPEVAGSMPGARVALLVSGTQGEPLSALSLMGVGEQRDIRVDASDIVVHSARVIPGNDRAVGRVFDNLHRRGCEVVHGATARVHVSGHGARDDLATMLRLVRPRHFIPMHGEYRMLSQHARLAVETGLPPERVLLVEDGQALSLSGDHARRDEVVATGRVLLDRSSAEGIDEGVVKDRRHLSSSGIVVPIIVLEKETGRLGSPPEIVARGMAEAGNDLAGEAARRILRTIETRTPEEHRDASLMRERVRVDLVRFYKRRTQRRPLVVPVVMEV